ncbi:MAG: S-methyl-5-thioribose-1-phosphate isomerase [Candidatus Ancaeobacter aquaticus]|nr:S-methyl-5-thioribose-1-phosphate isomerase [Candidatus Ancaeobacter aquaticus]
MVVKTVEWNEKSVKILDQTKLPEELIYINCKTREELWEAIKMLRVRGAPLLGVIGALAVALDAHVYEGTNIEEFRKRIQETISYMATSRPTAVNLFWGLKRIKKVIDNDNSNDIESLRDLITKEAVEILSEDKEICKKLGDNGAVLLEDGATVMTHCNAGALATAGMGTALAVMYAAHEQGKKFAVYADETRPLLQGARLTAWELKESGIDVTLICDNMVGSVMKNKGVDCVIVGADRIAMNGDTANKIGTYNIAVLAKHHNIPFYIVAPISTVDSCIETGSEIPIEERGPEEITHGFGKRTAPLDIKTFSPAFDVTPGELITAIVTERGIVWPPYNENMKKVMEI